MAELGIQLAEAKDRVLRRPVVMSAEGLVRADFKLIPYYRLLPVQHLHLCLVFCLPSPDLDLLLGLSGLT